MKISLFDQIETFSHLCLYLFHYVIKHIDNPIYFVDVFHVPAPRL